MSCGILWFLVVCYGVLWQHDPTPVCGVAGFRACGRRRRRKFWSTLPEWWVFLLISSRILTVIDAVSIILLCPEFTATVLFLGVHPDITSVLILACGLAGVPRNMSSGRINLKTVRPPSRRKKKPGAFWTTVATSKIVTHCTLRISNGAGSKPTII